MNRTFPITEINAQWSFRRPISVVQQTLDGEWLANSPDLPGIEGRAKDWPTALQDFRDNLIGAVEAGQLKELIVEHGQSQVVESQAAMKAPPNNHKIFILLDDGKVVTWTDNAVWARRWATWRDKGSFVESAKEEFPE